MKSIDRTGEVRINNEGYRMIVVESFSSQNNTIMFDDGLKLYNIRWDKIEDGQIKNPHHRSVCEIGYVGVGKFIPNLHRKSYNSWSGMIKRCYSLNELNRCPTYKGCTVCKEWQCFQNFAQWYEDNCKSYMEKWHLDKDILVKGNKAYSPENCILVHPRINSIFTIKKSKYTGFLTGVSKRGNKFSAQITKNGNRLWLGSYNTEIEAFNAYKIAKEFHIKETANEFKGLISNRGYQAMMNYKVEIGD